MIERVAIALFSVNGIAEDWPRYSEKTREGYRAYARAAIGAMRDRDEAMLDAGTAVLMPPLIQGARGYMPGSTAVAVWEAMIDAALSLPPSPRNRT